ncbi:MAG: hypothetical protein MJZ20_00280 [Bacteroidaceae bacterium]|nr:hypothetical protein [Bacteroidaceae bacterium]
MGLSAITRNGWKKNPLKQGLWNLKVSVICSLSIPLIGYMLNIEEMANAIIVAPIFLLWGIVSFVVGITLDRLNRKAIKEAEQKQ